MNKVTISVSVLTLATGAALVAPPADVAAPNMPPISIGPGPIHGVPVMPPPPIHGTPVMPPPPIHGVHGVVVHPPGPILGVHGVIVWPERPTMLSN